MTLGFTPIACTKNIGLTEQTNHAMKKRKYKY